MPQVPNPAFGHQLDDDTLALYKFGEIEQGVYTGTVRDETGLLPLTIVGDPQITNSTPGLDYVTFARWFDGSNDYLSSGGPIPEALRTPMVEGTSQPHTWEVLFRFDLLAFSGTRTIATISGTSESAADDFLGRVVVTGGGEIECFWERSGFNQQATTSGAGIVPGQWHVVHVTREDRVGEESTKWTTSIYVDGVLINTFDTDGSHSQGTGLKPNTTSGTNARLGVGANAATGTNDFFGAIGHVRIVSSLMSPAQISSAATALLDTGEVSDGLTAYVHYKLNEQPDLIDEGPWGFHMETAWPLNRIVQYNEPKALRPVDLVGTGGRGRAANNQSSILAHRMGEAAFNSLNGRTFLQYFNDDFGVPEYTVAGWFTYSATNDATTLFLSSFGGSGESLATNFLYQIGITTQPVWNDSFFAERGSGVNITPTPGPAPILNVNEPGENFGRIHWAFRMREDPGNAGEALVEHFINGQLVSTRSIGTDLPQGGTSATLRLGPWIGWIQDLKISRIARTDAEILSDYERVSNDL